LRRKAYEPPRIHMPSFEGLTPAKEAELKENLWKIAKFEKAIKKVATQYQYASVLKGCIYHTAPQRNGAITATVS